MSIPRLTVVAVAVAIVVVAWPRVLGGAASYVVVSGVSMEPTYETGDLVVTRTAGEYEVGDVIAFRTEDGDVIHRITGGDAVAGFETQGDNVDRADPYRPRPAHIMGRAVLHVPAVGGWGLRLVRAVPAPVLAAAAIMFGLGGAEGARRRRRRRPSGRRSRTSGPGPMSSKEHTVSTSLGSRPRIQVAAACVVAAVVVLPSAFLAWRAPTTTEVAAAEADVRHEVTVSVIGIAERASSLYPEGRSEPVTAGAGGTVPEDAPTLLRSQIDELLVRVDHEVVGADAVSGAGRVDVVLVTGRGFEMDLNGVRMQQFTGRFHAEVTLALDAIDERFETYLDDAELANDSMTIEVRPLVAAGDGVTVQAAPTVISPQGEVITVEGALRSVATAEGETATVTATAPLVGVPLPVPVVRVVGTGLVVGLLLVAGLLLRRELEARPDLRIGLLHGSLLVDIESDANVGGEIVRVTSIAELTRLAKRDQRTILHQEREGGRHHYLVPDGDLTYEYVVDVEGRRAPGIGLDIPDDASTLEAPVEVEAEQEPGPQDPEGQAADTPGPVGPEAVQDVPEVAPRRVVRRRVVDVTDVTDASAAAGHTTTSGAVEAEVAGEDPTQSPESATGDPSADTVRDYLPVAPGDLPQRRTVMVDDFTELLRIWMQDNTAPGRLQQRRLAHGGMRYSVVRNGREFVYEAAADEGVSGVVPRGSGSA